MKPITLLQWNILFTEQPSNIVRFLKELRPDICCLQELTSGFAIHNGQNVPALIAQELGYNHFAKLTAGSLNTGDEQFGSGIFTRFPIVRRESHWINQYDPRIEKGYDNEYKAYVEATLQIDSRRLTVGTTHMSYTHRFIDRPRKRQEADRLLQTIGNNQRCYIFSGDLNSRPRSYTVRSMGSKFISAGPDLSINTWATKPFSYRGFREAHLNWRLDYVFTTKDVKVVSSEVLHTQYSDHLPILTTFTL